MDAGAKGVWASKTWWVSLALASLGEFHPQVNLWVNSHPDTVLLGTISIYLVLRHFTTTSIHYGAKK